MPLPFSALILRALAGLPRAGLAGCLPLLADDCALRLGSRPTLYGRPTVEPQLRTLIERLVSVGRCGCDITGGGEYWAVETDLTLAPPASSDPLPCVVTVRAADGLIKDLRFYVDLTRVPPGLLDPDATRWRAWAGQSRPRQPS